jgi:rRNA maturation RNase YbeY
MVSNIQFHIEGEVQHPFENKESDYIKWLTDVAKNERCTLVEVHYIFCTDDYLLGINQQYLGHDYYTDIITFPYQEGTMISGDMYISLQMVRENASEYQVTFENELQRVMVHGLLHLMGYNDKSESDIETMRQKEEQYLCTF